MKVCKICKIEKRTAEFPQHNNAIHGFSPVCSNCQHDKSYILKQIFYNKGFKSKSTFDKFKSWALENNEFNQLYDNWKESGFKSKLKPTMIKYNFVTMSQSKGTKKLRKVIQYTKAKEPIQEFESTHEAARCTRVKQPNIYNACKGKLKSAGGYIWSFA